VTFCGVGVCFNGENFFFFPSLCGGTISPPFPSPLTLPVEIVDPGGGGEGNSHMERQGMLVGKFEFNS